jgi:uncharacterized protein (TIGR02594 family)
LGCLKLTYQPRLEVHEQNSFLVKSAVEKKDHEVKMCLSSFTFGFNGQEGDNEVSGEGNSYAFKYRMHDARLGRFLSIDPLSPEYPWYSPYQFAGNKVIWARELEGLEEWKTNGGGNTSLVESKEVHSETFPSSDENGTLPFAGPRTESFIQDFAFSNNLDPSSIKPTEKAKPVYKSPWMGIAKSQLGITEKTGENDGTEVEMYLKTTGLGKGNPWCGGFVNYCLEEAGIDGVVPSKTDHPARALSWRKFGTKLDNPAYGAIATKSRKGGGHVAFIAGKTKDGKLVLLGGNQGDEVNYTPYPSDIFEFNFPDGYNPNFELPVMDVKGGKEIKEN